MTGRKPREEKVPSGATMASPEQATVALPPGFPEDMGQSFDPTRTLVEHQQPQTRSTNSLSTTKSLQAIPLSRWALKPEGAADPHSIQGPSPTTYRLQRMIGSGGFGEVWEAIQASLDRTVAMKRIREDLIAKSDEPTVNFLEASFRLEALVGARLEHPNIVPVYDLGMDDMGRPVLAMKVVHGMQWNHLIDDDFHNMSVTDFLAKHLPILIAVGNAVAYAHSRGVVHRDLKPSQVMVGKYGEVLLMDWGLAICWGGQHVKSRDHALPSELIPTPVNAANPAGTALFMAPEQTEPTAENVGPWTDVYLLGGMLYVLLTCQAPHNADTRELVFFRARLGAVQPPQEVVPDREVPEELAEIAMHAMRGNWTERILSAEDFVQRIQDYISGSSKRKESVALTTEVELKLKSAAGDYRVYSEAVMELANARALWPENPKVAPLREQALREFATAALSNNDLTLARVQAERLSDESERQHKLAEIALAEERLRIQAKQRKFAFASVAVLLVVLAAGGFKYTHDQRVARIAADKARTEATIARLRSERLTGFMLTDLTRQMRPIGRIALLDQVATEALAYYESVKAEALSAESALGHAQAFERIGEVFLLEGRTEDAMEVQKRALELREKAVAMDSADLTAQREVAHSHVSIAVILQQAGDLNKALESTEKAFELAKKVEVDNGEQFAREVKIKKDPAMWRSEMASALITKGKIQGEQGDFVGSLGSHRAGEAIRQAVVNRLAKDGYTEDEDGYAEEELAVSHSNVALALQATDDPKGAIESFKKALDIRQGLQRRDSSNMMRREQVGRTHAAMVQAFVDNDDMRSALMESARALEIWSGLADLDKLNQTWQREYATVLNAHSNLIFDLRNAVGIIRFPGIGMTRQVRGLRRAVNTTAALEFLNRALETRERIVEFDPANSQNLRDLSVSYNTMGLMLRGSGKSDEALAVYRKDLEIARRLVALDVSNARWKHDLGASCQALGELLIELDKKDEAFQILSESARIFEELATQNPEKISDHNDAAWGNVLVGNLLAERGDMDAARAAWTRGADTLAPFMKDLDKVEDAILDTYLQALIKLERLGEARPVAEALVEKRWDGDGFKEICEKLGVEPPAE